VVSAGVFRDRCMILSPRDALLFSIATLNPAIAHIPVPIVEELLPPWLRDFQRDMLTAAAAYMRQGYRRVLLQSPTGSGKTKMAEAALLSTTARDMHSQFLVHRKELIRQTSKSFTGSGLDHSFIAAKFDYDPDAMLHLVGIQTLIRRMSHAFPSNLRVVDEAHHATSDTYSAILEADPDAYILGLTATPERLDGRGLDDQFDVMVPGPPVSWLIEQGYLARYEYFAPDTPDFTGVKSVAGDFAREAAAQVVDKPKIVGSVVEHYLRLAKGFQGIVFAQNRRHSRHIADEFNAHGIPAMHVDGEMNDKQRDYFDDAFRAGDLLLGVNVGLFGEGYDVPNIRYVGIAAGTRSLVNHLQWCGRGLRPPDPAVICDHAGNAITRNLGLPDSDREWSLLGRAARRAASGCNDDATPVRQCLVCFRVSYSGVKTCACGTEFPAQIRKVEVTDGKLKKLEQAEMKRRIRAQREREEKACKSWLDFKRLGEARGYPEPGKWASARCRGRSVAAARWR